LCMCYKAERWTFVRSRKVKMRYVKGNIVPADEQAYDWRQASAPRITLFVKPGSQHRADCSEAIRKIVTCHAQDQPDYYLNLVFRYDVLYHQSRLDGGAFTLTNIASRGQSCMMSRV
jgi:hypothetical protein